MKAIDTSPLTAALDAREGRVVASDEDDVAAVLALLAWGVCRAAGRDSRYVVLPQDVRPDTGEYE